MTSLPELKNTFIDNLNKVAIKLGKNIHSISRDKYLEVVRELNLPRLDLFSLGGYRNLVNQISENSVAEIVPDYSSMFKNSLLEVSNILEKHVMYITRDEYVEIGKHNNTEFLSKHRLQELGGFTLLKNTLFKDDISKETNKANILLEFKNYVAQNKEIPTLKEVRSMGKIKGIFDSIEDVEEAAKEAYPEINDYIFNESSFTPEYRKALEQEMKKYKRFVVTTAVSGKKADDRFLSSIKNYANRNNAMVLIMPCEDVFSRKKTHSWNLDPSLKQFKIVFKDTYLNSNLYLSNIKVSAKMINPQTGLPQFTQEGTCVLASPKQDLNFIANSLNKVPHAIMTTGAVTCANYDNDLYMSNRINKIAEFDHIVGAIIFEIQNNTIFHFRQVQAGPDGSITDLGVKYSPNGNKEKVTRSCMVIGDSHFGEHDEHVLDEEKRIIKELNIDTVVLHDIFTASSITHHDKDKTITRAIKANEGKISLEAESEMVALKIMELMEWVPNKIIIVPSNHHDHLSRYIQEGRYSTDPTNLYYALDIVKAFIEGLDPFEYMMREKTSLKRTENSGLTKLTFLDPMEGKSIHGVEVSLHGHLGSGGARGSLTTYRKSYKKSISGHSHTPCILKGAWSVGTSSKLFLGYNLGLSSWVHSCAVIYPDGTRQLINIIKDAKTNKYTWRT